MENRGPPGGTCWRGCGACDWPTAAESRYTTPVMRTIRLDLGSVELADQAVLELAVGAWRAEHQRRWVAKKRKLLAPS